MVDSLEREKLIFDQSINAKDGAIDEDVNDAEEASDRGAVDEAGDGFGSSDSCTLSEEV